MDGWLNSLINFVTGPFRALWNFELNIIRTVERFLEGRINQVQYDVTVVQGNDRALATTFADFVTYWYASFVNWVRGQLTSIINQVNRNFASLQGDIRGLSAWATSQFDALGSYIASSLLGLIKWIISAVFGPLRSLIGQALGWIAREGAYLFDILTHMDKLLALVFKFLFDNWAMLATKFGALTVAWILANWRKTYPTLIAILEDIIVKVLLGR